MDMPARQPPAARLSRETWADAALEALAERGVRAVAVEPLAAALGVTKGSFYWHFRNREELLEAALARWRERGTEDVIRQLEQVRDPRERLRELFRVSFGDPRGGKAEAALLASDDPVVRAALPGVTARRLDFLAATLTDLALAPAAARHGALLAYTAYVGFFSLGRADPHAVPAGEDLERYLDDLVQLLCAAGAGGSPSPAGR